MEKGKNTILLIDANALIHRAYHGLPSLKTKKGVLVNAVYGFTSSVLSAIKEFHPEYIVIAFDVGKKTFRNDEYKEYKANRVKMDDELAEQLPLVRKVVEAFNWPEFGVKNFEADDVIGTICSKVSNFQFSISNSNQKKLKTDNCKLKTIVVTGDMDTLQLVNDNVSVYSMSRGIKKAEVFTPEKVKEKYGFEGKYLVDYKGLRGDPSDNIPGVKGIGEKSATDLIKRYGSIENLYTKISNFQFSISNQLFKSKYQMSKKIAELLLNYKEQAYMSKKLATIREDTPLDFRLEDAKVAHYDPEKVKKVFDEFEFKSLLAKLPESKVRVQQKSLF